MAKDKTAEVITDDIAKKIVKRTRPDRSAAMSIQADPGDNARFLAHSLSLSRLPDIDMTKVDQVDARIDQFFDLCVQHDMKPSVADFALAFGVDRVSMWRWANGQTKGIPLSVVTRLKKAYGLINSQMENYMQNGKINPVAGIFLMKNNMGYSDKTEIIVESNVNEVEPQMLLEEAEILPDGE